MPFVPEDDLVKLFARAVCVMQEREFDEAIRQFDHVIEIEPTMGKAYALRGGAKFFRLQMDEALEDFNTALDMDPQCVTALAYRGQYHAYHDNFDLALNDLGQALELDPRHEHALRIRANVYHQSNRLAEAETDTNALIALKPHDEQALLKRAWLRQNAGRLAEAWQDNARCLELNPDDEEALLQRAHLFNTEANYEKVVQAVDDILRMPHELAERPGHLKSWALIALGRYKEALELLDEVVKVEPLPIVFYARAVALGRLECLEACREHIQAAREAAEKIGRDDVFHYMDYLLKTWNSKAAQELCILNFDRELLLWPAALTALENENAQKALTLLDEILQIDPISLQAYHHKSVALAGLERYKKALETIDIGLAIQETPLLLFRKAMILMEAKNYEESLRLFDRVVFIAPDVAVYYLLLLRAQCYADMNHPDKALGDFAQILYFMPEHVGALHGRALLYFDRGQWELALLDEVRALKRATDFVPGLVLKGRAWGMLAEDAEQAEKEGKSGIPVGFPELSHEKFYTAEFCWTQCLADLDQAVAWDADDLVARWCRGYFAAQIGHYEKCVEDFTIYLEAVPDSTQALYWRGYSWDNLGEHERAIADFDQLIELEPDDAANLYARGTACNRAYRFAEAERDFLKARELTPTDAAFLLHDLGHTLEWQGRYEEALPYLKRALELRPEIIEWYSCLAEVLIQLKMFDQAVNILEESVERDPNQSQAYLMLGELWERQGQNESAQKNFALAARLPHEKPGKSQESEEIELVYRGRALAALGRHEEALDHLERGTAPAERKQRFHGNMLWLARSLDALGQSVEALNLYRLALEHALVCHIHHWWVEHCQKRIAELEREL